MTTVCDPGSGRVSASFAAVAKHYGVSVKICPPRRGNRKGVVEKAVHVAAQRWWRTLPDDVTVDQAQVSLDKWCQLRGDTRIRRTKNGRYTVATLVAAEPLSPVPAVPFPAELSAARTVSGQSLVAWAGNFYSVPAALARAEVTCRVRLGADLLTISPADQPATVVAAHHPSPGRGWGDDPVHRPRCGVEHRRHDRRGQPETAWQEDPDPAGPSRPRGGRRPDRPL